MIRNRFKRPCSPTATPKTIQPLSRRGRKCDNGRRCQARPETRCRTAKNVDGSVWSSHPSWGGVYRRSSWRTQPVRAESAASPLTANEQPLMPDTPVTTTSWDHLDYPIHSFIVAISRSASRISGLPKFRYPEHLSTDTVRARDLHSRAGKGVEHQWRRGQRRATRRRTALRECPCRRRNGERVTNIRGCMRRVAQPERRRGHPA
jgi:hypothetical protein